MPVLAVDIGGTAIKYAVMDEKMRFLSSGSVPTPGDREGLVEAIGELFDSSPSCRGIAISMAGIIDSEKGLVEMGGALRYNDGFYFRDALQARCPVPVAMENDAKCAAIAEAADGSLKDVANGMVLLFGTMIGGGVIIDHKLYRGSRFSAGEVSYTVTDRDGTPDFGGVWGNRCGVPRLGKLYAEKKGIPAEGVSGRTVFDAVSRGDSAAREALDIYTREIAVQIFNFQNLLDPERIAIGGGISAQPVFIEKIKEQMDALYAACPYFVRRAAIVPCAYRNDANLYGAYRNFVGK